MSTSIRIEAWKDEKTTNDQWDKIVHYFHDKYDSCDEDTYYINSGVINCSYRSAEIRAQIEDDVIKELEGSGINISLWFEEREPDETLTL